MPRARRPFSPIGTPAPPRPPFPTVDEIAARAHELFVRSGRRLNDIPEHWRAAEQELLERAATRVVTRQMAALGGSTPSDTR